MKIDRDTFGHGGVVRINAQDYLDDELKENEVTIDKLIRYQLPIGTRIAVIDGGINDEPFNTEATIIECDKPTDVISRNDLDNSLGYGDPDIYLRDDDMVICIGAEPTEQTASDGDIEKFKKFFGVQHVVACM